MNLPKARALPFLLALATAGVSSSHRMVDSLRGGPSRRDHLRPRHRLPYGWNTGRPSCEREVRHDLRPGRRPRQRLRCRPWRHGVQRRSLGSPAAHLDQHRSGAIHERGGHSSGGLERRPRHRRRRTALRVPPYTALARQAASHTTGGADREVPPDLVEAEHSGSRRVRIPSPTVTAAGSWDIRLPEAADHGRQTAPIRACHEPSRSRSTSPARRLRRPRPDALTTHLESSADLRRRRGLKREATVLRRGALLRAIRGSHMRCGARPYLSPVRGRY